jgi:hypothetical protein
MNIVKCWQQSQYVTSTLARPHSPSSAHSPPVLGGRKLSQCLTAEYYSLPLPPPPIEWFKVAILDGYIPIFGTIAYYNHGQTSGYLAVTEKPRLLKITCLSVIGCTPKSFPFSTSSFQTFKFLEVVLHRGMVRVDGK